jgi:hypothetical protein
MVVAHKPLVGGDYMFTAHGKVVGLEVKWSIGDLSSSLVVKGEDTGTRLGIEVRKMLAMCDIPILIVPALRDRGDGKLQYDSGAPVNDRGWEYNAVKGILSDVALFGVIVDEWDGDIAGRIAQWYYVTSHKQHDWIRQRGRPDFVSLDPTYTQSVWALCAAYGWGPETAEEALKALGSVKAVMSADRKRLMKVRGVGPILADSMLKVSGADFRDTGVYPQGV